MGALGAVSRPDHHSPETPLPISPVFSWKNTCNSRQFFFILALRCGSTRFWARCCQQLAYGPLLLALLF